MRCSCQFRRRGRRRAHLRLIGPGFRTRCRSGFGSQPPGCVELHSFCPRRFPQVPDHSPALRIIRIHEESEQPGLRHQLPPGRHPKKTIGIVLTAISRKGISFQQPVIPESGVYSITHDPVHADVPHRPRRPFAGPSRRALTGLSRVRRGAAARPSSAGRAASGRCAGPVGASAAHAGARLMH
jgi:hypothetical protein